MDMYASEIFSTDFIYFISEYINFNVSDEKLFNYDNSNLKIMSASWIFKNCSVTNIILELFYKMFQLPSVIETSNLIRSSIVIVVTEIHNTFFKVLQKNWKKVLYIYVIVHIN